MTRILVIILSVIALAACSRTLDDKLVRVNRLANENLADSAIQALDSIDRASLDEYNRHYYDLMTVKTRDKADFQFDSDSLVLSAMEYFKKNGTDTVRAEAFYYAGRVARMLGDSPQALDYMQNALNCLDDSHTRLKGKLSSQMGQIFLNLYLFEQAKTRFKDAVIYNRDSRVNIISGVDESTRIPVKRILTSDVFMRIKNALYTENYNLNESDWSELSDIVNEEYHNFRNKLYLLNNKISAHEYRVCLLIKCGFSPNETSKLLNRSKEAISSTRRRLCYKCFLVKSSPENFDKFIYSL